MKRGYQIKEKKLLVSVINKATQKKTLKFSREIYPFLTE